MHYKLMLSHISVADVLLRAQRNLRRHCLDLDQVQCNIMTVESSLQAEQLSPSHRQCVAILAERFSVPLQFKIAYTCHRQHVPPQSFH